MLTPKFTCSQEANKVFVEIHTPAIRASDVELSVDGNLFSLFVNPYFLRLQFPGDLVEDDESSANYDPSTATLRVVLTKAEKGRHFPDLDLLSKLLAPVRSQQAPQIEVLGSEDADSLDDALDHLSLGDKDDELAQAIESDWQIPQEPNTEPKLNLSDIQPYGFLGLYSGLLTNIAYTENEVNELGSDAESLSLDERRSKREAREDKKFDEDYYLSDLFDDDDIQELIRWRHPFHPGCSKHLTPDENEALLRLPSREHLVEDSENSQLLLLLVSLLLPYAYDSRTTQHEPTSESAWTISALTPLFTALDSSIGASLDEILRVAYRRMLSFPLYRSWALCERCRMDVAEILSGGRRVTLKALLEMKKILEFHDVYYVYSKIWIEDFCVWIQKSAKEEEVLLLGERVSEANISKDAIGWGLKQLEDNALRSRDSDSDDETEEDDDVENQRPSALP